MFVVVVLLIRDLVHRSFTVVLVRPTTKFSFNEELHLGIGRSGTFVLVDSILKMVRKSILDWFIFHSCRCSLQLAHTNDSNGISLFEVLAHIRTQRNGLIQTPEQLR